MSSFGAKRKARVVKVADENEATEEISGDDVPKDEPTKPLFGSKANRKPFRQSGLRKSFNPADGQDALGNATTNDNDEDDGPAVVRPAISRSGSLKNKKRPNKSSRLSFGGDDGVMDGADSSEVFTPKKVPLGQRALENSAIKKGVSSRGLPVRSFEGDEDRPKYSKEYLEELQSSTPNTPQKGSTIPQDDSDLMDLDASELEGALVVESTDLGSPKPTTSIPTDAEIREKKERRVRLAQEQDFLSLEDDEDPFGRKKKDDTRLIAEDEDLGEGFDNYVEDGGLSLGKKAEKERRKTERKQMAELISAAEGHDSDSSSDSDAERRIAYEAAQSRAGLDGLKKPRKDPAQEALQVPPKIAPLPSLTECLARLQATLGSMEKEMGEKQARMQKLKSQREEIVKREAEVQALLDETGRKYQEAMNQGKAGDVAASANAPSELIGARGLETLGTPSRMPDGEEKP